jgi:hypothetical protein
MDGEGIEGDGPMDQDAIDRLQCQYFQKKLATVEASKLQEAARRARQVESAARQKRSAVPPPRQEKPGESTELPS